MVFKQNMSFNKKKKSLHKLKISDKSKKNKAAKPVIPDLTAAIEEINDAVAKLQGIEKDQSSKCRATSATSAVQSGGDEKTNTLNSELDSELPKATPPGVNEIAQFLQTWLEEQQIMFQNFAELVPQLDNTVLDTTDRRRLNGSGVRRYGFIEKVIEVAGEYPQFWPAFVEDGDVKQFGGLVKEIDVLRNLSIWFQFSDRVVQDLLLLAGDEAFRWAGLYYTTARDTARRKIPEAMQVYEKLRLFWNKRRRTNGEPTEREVMCDARALMRGKKDGEVTVKNESDRVVKGERVVIDNTQRKPRGGVKIVDKIREE